MHFIGFFLFLILCFSLACFPIVDPFETQQKHLEEARNKTKLRYHPAEDQIKEMYGFTQEYTDIVDDRGNPKRIPKHKTQGSLLYYQPGSKPYEDYQMDYTDAIMFSKL